MAITVAGLAAADVGAIRSAAARWRGLADAVDIAVEDLSRGTMDLSNHWSGPGEQACMQRRDALCAQLGDFYESFAEKATLFAHWADDLQQAQGRLQALIAAARYDGVDIDVRTGLVSAVVVGPGGTAGPAGQDTIDGYARQVKGLLLDAGSRDGYLKVAFEQDRRQLSATLADRGHLAPAPGDKWPAGLTTASAPTLADVAGDPTTAARVWQATNPVLQEQTIIADPMLVATTEGLPSRDRDAANRILMTRDKQALQARQAELAARPGRAAADVDARLAAISRLETRLDDPGRPKTYLMSYRTGDEQNSVLGSGNTPWDTPTP
jgi:hypothetical protein